MKKPKLLSLMTLVLALGLVLTSCGQKSQEGISQEEAKKIGAESFGLEVDQLDSMKIKEDKSDGLDVYELDFRKDNVKYELEINRLNGDIISSEKEELGIPSPSDQELISQEEAEQLVLDRVEGADKSHFKKFKLDREDGRAVYEGELVFQSQEYDFTLDASSGEFISWEEETR